MASESGMFFRSFKQVSVVLVLLLGATSLVSAAELKNGRPSSVGLSAERLDRIKPVMQAYVDKKQLAGITTMIARKGKIVHFETVGKLNLNTGEALQPDSLHRIYSMTKPVVAVALMQLHEQGKFQLDEPLSKYLPEFKGVKVWIDGELVEPKHEPTIREVMSHTAGFTYGIFGATEVDKIYREALYDPAIPRDSMDLKAFIGKMGELPLLYQPGERWVYSLASDVVGRLIEVLSGKALDVYLQEDIFEPLGMVDTFFEVPQDKLSRFGTNHIANKEGVLTVMDAPETSRYTKDVKFFSGGGGLVSTAMDYMRFAQMLVNGGELHGERILSRKTIELMTTNQLEDGVKSGFGERPGVAGTFGFGLGFGIATSQPKTVTGSKGEYTWGGAAGTVFWVDPKEELVGILMVQMMRNPHNLRGQFKALTYQAFED